MDRVYVMQLVRSLQCGYISRRTFLRQATVAIGSLTSAQVLLAACGSAPAETPPPPVVVAPEVTATPADMAEAEAGLITEQVEYPGGATGTLMGYMARPDATGVFPAVVVIQEWWGLNENIKDITRRFAREGFVALAPDFYNGVVTSEPDEARKLVMELDTQAAVEEIGQALAFLLEQPYTAGNTAGIVGFCMGGRLVLQAARTDAPIGAAVAFYGTPLTPEEAAEVTVPVLGLYGAEDTGIAVEDVQTMEQAFEENGVTHAIQVYAGASHAFFNDTRDVFAPDAAADAWSRTLTWFRTYLEQTGRNQQPIQQRAQVVGFSSQAPV